MKEPVMQKSAAKDFQTQGTAYTESWRLESA